MYATRAEPCWATVSRAQSECSANNVPSCSRSAQVWVLLTEIADPEQNARHATPTDLPDELWRALDGWMGARSL